MSQEIDNLARLLLEFAVSLYPDQKRGWKSRFAERLGVTPQQLSDMLNGRKGIGEVQQKRLAELGLNLNWLLTGKGSMNVPKIVTLRRINVVPITKLGETMHVSESESEYADVPEEFADQIEGPAIRIMDDSMAGVVWKDDVVFVSPDREADNNDLCLVNVKGEGYALRHIYSEGESVILLATNAPPRTIPRSQFISIQRVVCANISGAHLKRK